MATKETKPAIRGLNGANGLSGSEVELLKQLPLTVTLEDEIAKRVDVVGGKAASLVELGTIPGITVPDAFIVTTLSSDKILEQNPEIKDGIDLLDGLSRQSLKARLEGDEIEAQRFREQITAQGELLRSTIGGMIVPEEIENEISSAYQELCRKVGKENVAVAVRSSGISEDGNDNSFAGQYDSFLHRQGKEQVLNAFRDCLKSQFTGRAIGYRNDGRFEISKQVLMEDPQDIDKALKASEKLSHEESKLAVVVQEMVNASASGVAFSIDSNTGADFVVIQANNGIGESLVGGAVTPDYIVVDPRKMLIVERRLGKKRVKTAYVNGGTENVEVSIGERSKFALTDEEAIGIAKGVLRIKKAYGKEVDTEWALDQSRKDKWLQARPETVASKKDSKIIEMQGYIVPESIAEEAEVVLQGGMTGSGGTASGEKLLVDTVEEANRILELEENKNKDFILATAMTTPDWLGVMRDKRIKAIITESGAPDCHAAIVSREVEIPCLVGTEEAFDPLRNDAVKEITLDADALKVYKRRLSLEKVEDNIDVREILNNPTDIVIGINIAMPSEARKLHALAELKKKFKNTLSRAEFILQEIGVHVNALIDFDNGKIAPESDLYKRIAEKIAASGSGKEYFIDKLSKGIIGSASALPDSEMTYRTTDFKTNEYANLIGGTEYESKEANPMMGMRGLVRFLSPENREGFKWELEAVKKARAEYPNIQIMFPVVRRPIELTGGTKMKGTGYKGVYEIMDEVGLKRGKDGLKCGIMVEVPGNVEEIEAYIDAGIDFVSFGTNDLKQFEYAVDRDNPKLGKIPWYEVTEPPVINPLRRVIEACTKRGVETSICGNAPSDNLEFVKQLVQAGIGSIGVTKDRYLRTYRHVRQVEQSLKNQPATSTETDLFLAG